MHRHEALAARLLAKGSISAKQHASLLRGYEVLGYEPSVLPPLPRPAPAKQRKQAQPAVPKKLKLTKASERLASSSEQAQGAQSAPETARQGGLVRRSKQRKATRSVPVAATPPPDCPDADAALTSSGTAAAPSS
jgi:hypothetical protein